MRVDRQLRGLTLLRAAIAAAALVIGSHSWADDPGTPAIRECTNGVCDTDSSGGGSDRSSSVVDDVKAELAKSCKQNCLGVFEHCLAVSASEVAKDDCNRKQFYCTKSCD